MKVFLHGLLAAVVCALLGQIQGPLPGAAPRSAQDWMVPVIGEPHHHLVYSNEYVRVFDVEVPAHESTLLHQHDVDYLWVALGDADVINAVAGKPEARLQVKDATVHFTHGGFAHIARNLAETPFRNVTIELLRPQTNPRNLCDDVLAGQPANCSAATSAASIYAGAFARAAFETDQIRVSLLQIEPKRKMTFLVPETPPVLVALDGTQAEAEELMRLAGNPWSQSRSPLPVRAGDVTRSYWGGTVEVRNTGKVPARFLVLEFKGTRP